MRREQLHAEYLLDRGWDTLLREETDLPCDYSKYPSDWKEIRARILARADNKCETCGVTNYSYIFRSECGAFWYDAAEDVYFRYPSGQRIEGRFEADLNLDATKVVLTISHTNHDVSDNRLENLLALCQKCHNIHDTEYRKQNRAKTLLAKKACGTLF